jgi:hypothetical protein
VPEAGFAHSCDFCGETKIDSVVMTKNQQLTFGTKDAIPIGVTSIVLDDSNIG